MSPDSVSEARSDALTQPSERSVFYTLKNSLLPLAPVLLIWLLLLVSRTLGPSTGVAISKRQVVDIVWITVPWTMAWKVYTVPPRSRRTKAASFVLYALASIVPVPDLLKATSQDGPGVAESGDWPADLLSPAIYLGLFFSGSAVHLVGLDDVDDAIEGENKIGSGLVTLGTDGDEKSDGVS